MGFNIELERLTEKQVIKTLSDLAIYCKKNSIGLCGKCTKREIEKCLKEGEGITVSNKFVGIPGDVGELEINECTGFQEVAT